MKHTFTIPPEVLSILGRSSIGRFGTKFVLKLPPTQLPPKLYAKVNKAIVGLGGRWKREAAGHVFDADPSPSFGAALKTATVKPVRLPEEARKQDLGQFYTPPELAGELCRLANLKGYRVLEPSAGQGALVAAAIDAGAAHIDAVEIDAKNVQHLQKRFGGPDFTIFQDDFTEFAVYEIANHGGRWHRIVMNPPFKGRSGTKHFSLALSLLMPGGIIAAILQDQRGQAHFDKATHGARIIEHPMGSFSESGTAVRTVSVILKK